MNTPPLVSVIIPAFNAQSLIADTLDSILAQTYRNLEIIVVDDGSTDNTAAIVRGYRERVRYYYQENSGGCAVPRNTGIKYSSGDFLCFMDADDLMAPDRVTRQIEFMKRYPEVGVVFCDYRNFNEQGPYRDSHFQTCPRLWSQLRNQGELTINNPCALLAQENFGCAGSCLIRRDILKIVSAFEPSLKACEDFHFYFQAARYVRMGVINEVGMMRRLHGNNMSGNPIKMLTERIRSRTLLRDGEQDTMVRSYLTRYIADCQSSLGRYYAEHGKHASALQKEWQALSCDFSLDRLLSSGKNIMRTLMIAMGLHTPKEKLLPLE